MSKPMYVMLTGQLAMKVEQVLTTLSNQDWRPHNFRTRAAECAHKIRMFRVEMGQTRPAKDREAVFYLAEWSVMIILRALLYWKEEYYRVRRRGTKQWFSWSHAMLNAWYPAELEAGAKSRIIDEAIAVFGQARLVRDVISKEEYRTRNKKKDWKN